jgi:hypothetical protein
MLTSSSTKTFLGVISILQLLWVVANLNSPGSPWKLFKVKR